MSNLTITFAFEEQQVRVVGTPEKPEWIAQDVCDVLGIKEASSALRNFNPDQKGLHQMQTLRGNQEMLTVTEPGLYRLIFRSDKPIAEKFQRWIFHEVIPSIRRTGTYTLPDANPDINTETKELVKRVKRLELEQAKTKQILSIILQSMTVHNKEIIIDKPDETTIDLILNQLSEPVKPIQKKLSSGQQKPDKLELIIAISKRLGTVKDRDIRRVARAFRNDDPNQIREQFKELKKMGKGRLSGSGDRLAFTAYK